MNTLIRPLRYPVGEDGSRSYQIQEFAQLVGTTVRALQHYDRLGLLTPARTPTGARIYSAADLQALVQIMALKSVGVPLKKIGLLRAIGPRAMAEALEAERRALERKQPLLDRVIFAIRNVEAALGRGEEADPAMLKPLIAALKSDEADGTQEAVAAPEPSPAWDELKQEWLQLFADLERSPDLDPAGPALQEVALRWDLLMARSTGGGSYRAVLASSAATLESPVIPSTRGERMFATVGAALSRMAASNPDSSVPQRR